MCRVAVGDEGGVVGEAGHGDVAVQRDVEIRLDQGVVRTCRRRRGAGDDIVLAGQRAVLAHEHHLGIEQLVQRFGVTACRGVGESLREASDRGGVRFGSPRAPRGDERRNQHESLHAALAHRGISAWQVAKLRRLAVVSTRAGSHAPAGCNKRVTVRVNRRAKSRLRSRFKGPWAIELRIKRRRSEVHGFSGHADQAATRFGTSLGRHLWKVDYGPVLEQYGKLGVQSPFPPVHAAAGSAAADSAARALPDCRPC